MTELGRNCSETALKLHWISIVVLFEGIRFEIWEFALNLLWNRPEAVKGCETALELLCNRFAAARKL